VESAPHKTAPSGLLWLLSKPNYPGFTDAIFNKWYTEVHLVDVVNSGLIDLAVRYKNVDPTAKWPYLAIYRIPDLNYWNSTAGQAKFLTIPIYNPLLPDGKSLYEVITYEIDIAKTIQKFEGPLEQMGRGKGLRTEEIVPHDGKQLDAWYRRQHLDMLSMVDGYQRSTRYKSAQTWTKNITEADWYGIHEFSEAKWSAEKLKIVDGTKWSKKVLGESKMADINLWDWIAEHGAVNTRF
jgi:hypothetical protein